MAAKTQWPRADQTRERGLKTAKERGMLKAMFKGEKYKRVREGGGGGVMRSSNRRKLLSCLS